MPPVKRVTHRDVARHAGVSPAVVSYVINNGPRATAPDTRERVLQAIAELSYQPNASARGLRGQRTPPSASLPTIITPWTHSCPRTRPIS